MTQPPPDPVHILHDPSGSVTALAAIKSSDNESEKLISGSDKGVITIWDLNVPNFSLMTITLSNLSTMIFA